MVKTSHEFPADYSPSPARRLSVAVPAECAGWRLDATLAKLFPEHSRSRLQGWLKEGLIRLDGARSSPSARSMAASASSSMAEFAVRASADFYRCGRGHLAHVVFEDDDLVVIDKPAGLVVHPGNGNASGTLLNALLHHAPQLAGIPRAGIVHRLDKDTSGLLVVAKTLTAQTDLVRQMQARTSSGTTSRWRWARSSAMARSMRRSAAMPCSARKWPSSAPAARKRAPITRCSSASPGPPCSNAAWKPDARIRSASIWRRSSIRWPAIPSMARRRAAMRGSMPFRARRCMPGAWRCGIRQAARNGLGVAPAGRLRRTAGIPACLNSSFPTGRAARRARAVDDARGGISMPPWDSFNLGDHVGDNPWRWRRIALCCGANCRQSRVWLSQVHGTHCVDAATARPGEQADASFTRQRGVVCAVLTADCLPVLLCDERATVVGIAHAGWRGLAAGVIEATVAAMDEPGEQVDGLARTGDRAAGLSRSAARCATSSSPAMPRRRPGLRAGRRGNGCATSTAWRASACMRSGFAVSPAPTFAR
jgi:hypothetical protein